MPEASQSPELYDLLRRTGQGDERAFAALYTRTNAKLFGIALHICSDSTLAREALKECYVQIWNRAAEYSPELVTPPAWMAAIIRTRSIDLKRARAGRSSREGTVTGEALSTPAEKSFADLEFSDAFRKLTRCLTAIPRDWQEMILLAYYAGWSREELAQKFACSREVVQTQLRDSLGLIERCLNDR